jgi:hypothetical protein
MAYRTRTMSLTPSSEARIQLKADFINTMAGHLMAIGALTPLFGCLFVKDTDRPAPELLLAIALICFSSSVGLYRWASNTLKALDL